MHYPLAGRILQNMKTNIDLIIEHLEKEVEYLKSQQENCLNDRDYLGAESFQKPLIYTQARLRNYYRIKDHNYDKKKRLKMLIGSLKKDPNREKKNLENKVNEDLLKTLMKIREIQAQEQIRKIRLELELEKDRRDLNKLLK